MSSFANKLAKIVAGCLLVTSSIALIQLPASASATWGSITATPTSNTASLSATVTTNNNTSSLSVINYCYSTATITASATSTVATACTVPSGSTLLIATGSPSSLSSTASNGASATVTATLTGLTPGATYNVIAEAWRPSRSTWYVSASKSFTTIAGAQMTTASATNVGATSATLNANVNSLGSSTTYSFCYSTSTLSNCTGGTVGTVAAGTYTTSATTAINAVATGLSPLTTYNFQVKGVTGGTTVYGSPLSFTTTASGAILTSSAATSIASTSATLNGTINPNSSTSATVSFCYSTSSSLASCSGATVITLVTTYSGVTTSAVSTAVTGLASGTTYYYQLKAVQGGNTNYSPSPVQSFTTTGGPIVALPTVSAITGVGATFGATVTASGASSTVAFCYSVATITNCAGSSPVAFIAASQSPISSSASNFLVSGVVAAGLTPLTTYYYQAMIQNAAGTAYSSTGSFKTIGAPFLCNTNFYQVSATAPQLYQYSLSTNKFSTIGANTKSGFNALAWNPINNYMYVMNGSTIYIVDSTGAFTSIGTVSGAQTIGAGFIGTSQNMLTTNGSGAMSVINVAANPITASTFTMTTAPASSTNTGASWGSADVAIIQQANGSFIGYGMTGSTLNIISIASTSATSGVVTSKTVTSATTGQSIPSGAYGAAYADQSGNVFFFNNGNSQMWEITAAALASNTSTSIAATLITTASPLLSAANDGASCPLSTNPFSAPVGVNDVYSLTLNGSTPLTVNSFVNGLTSNDQSGTTFQISSVTYNATTTSTPGTTITGPLGTLNVTDFANGYFTFTPSTASPGVVTFTYSLIQTGVVGPLSSALSTTATINLLSPQTVTWSPSLSLSTTQSPYTPTLATSNGNGSISYAVVLANLNTAYCTVNATTGQITIANAGVCTISATAAQTSTYAQSNPVNSTFTINAATPVITWTTNFNLLTSASPSTPNVGAVSSSGGAISYAVSSAGTTVCTINASTGVLTYTTAGSCVIAVTCLLYTSPSPRD